MMTSQSLAKSVEEFSPGQPWTSRNDPWLAGQASQQPSAANACDEESLNQEPAQQQQTHASDDSSGSFQHVEHTAPATSPPIPSMASQMQLSKEDLEMFMKFKMFCSKAGPLAEASVGPSTAASHERHDNQKHYQQPHFGGSNSKQANDSTHQPQALWGLPTSNWNHGWDNQAWSSSGGNWNSSAWHDSSNRWKKPDLSDPPEWPDWTYFKLWKEKLNRWNNGTDIEVHKRGDKVLKTLPWDLQQKLTVVPESVLTTEEGVPSILKHLTLLSGEKEGDEMRKHMRAALFDWRIEKRENLTMFATRREQQFDRAELYDLKLPDTARALFLEEGCGLSDQGLQNLKTMTLGELDFKKVKDALVRLDVTKERLTGAPLTSHRAYAADDTASTCEPGSVGDELSDSDIDTEDEAAVLAEIEGLDLSEGEGLRVLVALKDGKKKTWSENKQLKQKMRTDRKSLWDRGLSNRGPMFDFKGSRHHRRQEEPRLTKDQLKKITKCARCGL